ncbi:MAG: DNA mismatch repair endonuclease MutL [Treponema sp.]|nr:DNA mismatch repair endonuclease MutL [Treponema sp.]
MPVNNNPSQQGLIQILPPEEAKRIAAGEVVERPAALVREFLDNAIDAGAVNIDVSVEEGGCKKVEVSDDGSGMTLEDLELCWLTYATSKIRTLSDLDTMRTLGFRGEALAAASAVARLEIITSKDGRDAWHLDTGPGENYPPKIEQTRRTKGTTVRALNLFDSIPARKRFLKREGSEAALCRQVFIDKALVFNDISFRYHQDGKLKDFLPGVNSKKERFASALLQVSEKSFLHEINAAGDGFTADIVIGGPELYRNDRRQLFIFANGRRIQDYSLVQALEYGSQGWFPNGTHPVGAIYIDIDPSLADFNIHPAKREVRFRDSGVIHHAISGAVKSFFHMKAVSEYSGRKDFLAKTPSPQSTPREEVKNETYISLFKDSEIKHNQVENKMFSNNNLAILASLRLGENQSKDMRYAGRVFGLFILIEWGDKLYIIDQHAAHERILYNKFLKEPIPKQELLSPIPFSTESNEEDLFLETKQEELSRLGVDIKKDGNIWTIEALPADWRTGDAQTIKEILELRSAGENMTNRWAATLCCRAAIKDGDFPDDETAFALGKEALNLPDPRCPHGRPVWTEITKEALFKAVRRN